MFKGYAKNFFKIGEKLTTLVVRYYINKIAKYLQLGNYR